MDLDSIAQFTGPLMQESLALAENAMSNAKPGDPMAAQQAQRHIAMYQVWFNLNTEMISLFKNLNLKAIQGINS